MGMSLQQALEKLYEYENYLLVVAGNTGIYGDYRRDCLHDFALKISKDMESGNCFMDRLDNGKGKESSFIGTVFNLFCMSWREKNYRPGRMSDVEYNDYTEYTPTTMFDHLTGDTMGEVEQRIQDFMDFILKSDDIRYKDMALKYLDYKIKTGATRGDKHKQGEEYTKNLFKSSRYFTAYNRLLTSFLKAESK